MAWKNHNFALSCKEITMVTRFSMPNENCSRRWYSKICNQISLSNNEINIWSVTFWWQIVLWESLESWPSVHPTSVHYISDNWLSCGLWFQKFNGHTMQFIGSYHVFFLLCHIVKEGPEKLRKFGFIASDFLVHVLYKV